MLGCIESCHLPSIQFVGVAPQTNTVLKNWFENERLEMRYSYRAQHSLIILLSCFKARISVRSHIRRVWLWPTDPIPSHGEFPTGFTENVTYCPGKPTVTRWLCLQAPSGDTKNAAYFPSVETLFAKTCLTIFAAATLTLPKGSHVG